MYKYAYINILGPCVYDCYFCIGKDIHHHISRYNHLGIHFKDWPRFDEFLTTCHQLKVPTIVITGLNTDPLLYTHLKDLIHLLHKHDFFVQLQTIGYKLQDHLEVVNQVDHVVLSVYSLETVTLGHITDSTQVCTQWKHALKDIDSCSIAVVVNRYNLFEFWTMLEYFSTYSNITHITFQQVYTETRRFQLEIDIHAFTQLHQIVHLPSEGYIALGKPVYFKLSAELTLGGLHYYTDGVVNESGLLVLGYLKSQRRK